MPRTLGTLATPDYFLLLPCQCYGTVVPLFHSCLVAIVPIESHEVPPLKDQTSRSELWGCVCD